ncbi:MAG TPA: tryptophan 7-halogenase [Burkholderiaceae bacterium]
MNARHADVFVIGAGPAGLCAALRLNQLGYRVILAERSTLWPRPQIGEALTPGVRNIVDLLDANDALAGVPLIARLPARVRWRSAETEDALHGDSAVVERARFDAALLALAEKRGVEVMRPARVSTQNATSGGWQLVLESEHGATLLEAGFVIDARGRAGGAARLDCAPALAASWAEWDCGTLPAQWHGTTRVEALATGWLWGTRLPDGSYRAMLLADPARQRHDMPGGPAQRLRAACAASRLFSELAATPAQTSVHVCAATPYLDIEAWRPGWIKTGDAAFAVDPISSSGVEKAMRFSLQAVTAAHTFLQSNDPAGEEIAGEFFEERLIETCARHCVWTRNYYAQAWCADEPFWRERSKAATPTGEAEAFMHWRDKLERQIRLVAQAAPSNPEPPAPPAPPRRHQAIRFSAGIETVRTLCVVNDQVQVRSALAHPRLPRPLAFHEDQALLPCLDILRRRPRFDEALRALGVAMDEAKALRLLAWLWRERVIESADA